MTELSDLKKVQQRHTIPVKKPKLEFVVCKICSKKFKFISATHLSKHNTTVDEYRIKYSNAVIMNNEMSQSLERAHEALRGKPISMDHRQLLSQRRKEWWQKKKITASEKTKMLNHARSFVDEEKRLSESLRGVRIYYKQQLVIEDADGNREVLQITKRRIEEMPMAQYNGGAIYRDGSIFPCLYHEDLTKLVQRYSLANGFSASSLRFEFVKREVSTLPTVPDA